MKKSLTFIEKRLQFLKMMSVRYGMMRPEEFSMESLFSFGGLSLNDEQEFTFSDAFSIGMSAAAASKTVAHVGASMVITFADAADLHAPTAIAVVPLTFSFGGVFSSSSLRAPLSVEVSFERMTVTFSGEGHLETFTATELGVTSELAAMALSATMKTISGGVVASNLSGSVTFTATVTEDNGIRLQGAFEGSFSVTASAEAATMTHAIAEVGGELSPSADVESHAVDHAAAGVLMDIGISVTLQRERTAVLDDFDGYTLDEMSGTLDSYNKIIF